VQLLMFSLVWIQTSQALRVVLGCLLLNMLLLLLPHLLC
jgi:hypothetical protein